MKLAAASKMVFLHTFFWIVLFGGITYRFREAIKRMLSGTKYFCRTNFALIAIFLALIEEAVAVAMNSLADDFGAPAGQYLTITNSYLDLVLFHSAIVFVPMFITWAWLYLRYDFTPEQAFLLFGISGFIAEIIINPSWFTALLTGGFWIFTYGIMIYTPAYAFGHQRKSCIKARWYHKAMAVALPLVSAVPVAFIISTVHPVTGFH